MSSARKRTQKAGSEPESSGKDQRDPKQQKSTTRPKKSRWVRCGPVKYLFIFVSGVFLLNYASLKRESTALRPKGAADTGKQFAMTRPVTWQPRLFFSFCRRFVRHWLGAENVRSLLRHGAARSCPRFGRGRHVRRVDARGDLD